MPIKDYIISTDVPLPPVTTISTDTTLLIDDAIKIIILPYWEIAAIDADSLYLGYQKTAHKLIKALSEGTMSPTGPEVANDLEALSYTTSASTLKDVIGIIPAPDSLKKEDRYEDLTIIVLYDGYVPFINHSNENKREVLRFLYDIYKKHKNGNNCMIDLDKFLQNTISTYLKLGRYSSNKTKNK